MCLKRAFSLFSFLRYINKERKRERGRESKEKEKAFRKYLVLLLTRRKI